LLYTAEKLGLSLKTEVLNRIYLFAKLLTLLLNSIRWWESQEVRDHWEDLDVGGWTILRCILERQDGMV
jgi:hypothetical protein